VRLAVVLFALVLFFSSTVSSFGAALKEGDDAAAFTGVDLFGNPVDISPLIGKQVIVLKFGSIYCSSCVKSITSLADLQKKHPENKLKVVGINLDIYGVFRVKRFYRGYRELVNYPIVIDEGLNISRTYGVSTLPSIVVIDKAGKIARTMLGYQESDLEPIMEFSKNLALDKSTAELAAILPQQKKPLSVLFPLNFTKTQQDSIYVVGLAKKVGTKVQLSLNGGSKQELVTERPMFYFRTPVSLGSNFIEVTYSGDDGNKISQAFVMFRDPKIGKGFQVPFPTYHYHIDENEVLCTQCHEMDPPENSEQNFMMITQMCLECHKELSAKNYVHGPITVGGCAPCHDFASQPERYGLFSAGSELCYGCHEGKRMEFSKDYIHGPLAAGICTICHSPHGTNEKYLLRLPQGEMCQLCHQQIKELTFQSSQHKPFGDGQCSSCHDPHSSSNPKFFLRGSGNELCFLCHDELQMEEHRHPFGKVPVHTFPGMKLTEAGETTCSSCHNPHATDAEYLLPQGGCSACHSF
jgi:predicted CXXCH cytochrome family protein